MPKQKIKTKKKLQLEAAQKKKIEQEEANQLLQVLKNEEELKAKKNLQLLELAKQQQQHALFETERRSRSKLESERHNRYCYDKQSDNAEAEWNDFISCNDNIRVFDIKDVYTFLSLSKDSYPSLENFDDFCSKLFPLLDDLQVMALNSQMNAELETCQNQLLDLVESKLEACTPHWDRCFGQEAVDDFLTWTGSHIGITLLRSLDDVNDLVIAGCRASISSVEKGIFRIARLPLQDRFTDHIYIDGKPHFLIGDIFSISVFGPLAQTENVAHISTCSTTITMDAPLGVNIKSLQIVRRLADNSYTQEGILQVITDERLNSLTFQCHETQSVFALVHSQFIRINKWTLEPSPTLGIHGEDSVLLTLVQSQMEYCISISRRGCSLLLPIVSNCTGMNDMSPDISPGKLIQTLRKIGINFVGRQVQEGDKNVERSPPVTFNPSSLNKIEMVLYPDLSLLSTAFQITSADDGICICELRENIPCIGANTAVGDSTRTDGLVVVDVDSHIKWKLCKCIGKMDISDESDSSYSPDFHLYPMCCLRDYQDSEKLKTTSPVLTQNVSHLLNLIRPLLLMEL